MSDGICVVDLERKQPEEPSTSTAPIQTSSSKTEIHENDPLNNLTDEVDLPGSFFKEEECCSVAMESFTTAASSLSLTEFCKICHCGAEPSMPLIAPCFCDGSLKYVHQGCLQKWIKSSDIKRCELCKYLYIMQSKVKPFCEWEKLEYVISGEEEASMQYYVPYCCYYMCDLVFCKVYVHLCRKWKAYNRIIVIQDTPDYTLKPKIKKVSIALPTPPPPTVSTVPEIYSPTTPNPVTSPQSSTAGRGGRSSSRDIPTHDFNFSSHQKYTKGNSSLSSSAPDISTKASATHQPQSQILLPSSANITSKSNAETQTALRGVSLLRVLRDSSESDDPADLRAVSKILIDDSNTSIFIANCEETRQQDMKLPNSGNLLLPGQSSEEEESVGHKVNQVGD
ncbi:MARCH1_8 [Lepeophtheirus salmonis]|uniref:MARCH1_8 n=2 Tax=Lepeophtheirus salmonis TaxID=72036 RepID=A0A7R8H1T1_LEPSM|nr:MARCH1_8 [Lepeophtheirus salmonis]CAF2799704.1 MARCH1_8 [Lepeophtheirus salmonis]